MYGIMEVGVTEFFIIIYKINMLIAISDLHALLLSHAIRDFYWDYVV